MKAGTGCATTPTGSPRVEATLSQRVCRRRATARRPWRGLGCRTKLAAGLCEASVARSASLDVTGSQLGALSPFEPSNCVAYAGARAPRVGCRPASQQRVHRHGLAAQLGLAGCRPSPSHYDPAAMGTLGTSLASF